MDDYKEWLRFAHNDLEAAKWLCTKSEFSHIVIFHCHECIEKALKAIWIMQGGTVRKTHDIRTLLQNVWDQQTWLKDFEDGVADIHEYYGQTRYPASENIGMDDARQCVVIAEVIFETISKHLDQ